MKSIRGRLYGKNVLKNTYNENFQTRVKLFTTDKKIRNDESSALN